jgi:hypothetical protein
MPSDENEKYLLSGLDDRHRGFSRQLDIDGIEGKYRAALQYEKLGLASEAYATKEEALLWLVKALHTRGFRQLRSRLNFRGETYLGGLVPWIDHPDPIEEASPLTLLQRMGGLWERLFHS